MRVHGTSNFTLLYRNATTYGINKDLQYTVKLCLEAGPGCYTAKADMKSAFRNLPIKPQDWMLLVMMAKNPISGRIYYFVDKCLPFRASISCSHFQHFSNCVAFLCYKKTGKKVNKYVDDFFFAALMSALCNGSVYEFLNICEQINFPVAPEKTVWVMTIIVFLGILINTETQTISVPLEKCIKALNRLEEALTVRSLTILKLQQLAGLLNFIS